MNRFLCTIFFLSLTIMNPVVSHARQTDGGLGFIVNPSSTRPSFAQPGGRITVDVKKSIHDSCSCAFSMFLVAGGQRVMLLETRRDSHAGPDSAVQGKTDSDMDTYRYTTMVPASTPPGLYTLEARKGANQDFSNRAVQVVDKFPDSYKILHITDIHTGREKVPGADPTMLFEAMPEISNELRPDVVMITGDATGGGSAEEFKRFLDVLDRFDAPTLVTPGNHDDKENIAGYFLGAGNFSVPFGNHVFLSMDTRMADTLKFPDETGRMKWLGDLLAEFSSATLKIVFTHEYDGPLDAFLKELAPGAPDIILLGHTHSNRTDESRNPAAKLLETPAYADGFYRIITVEDSKFSGEKLVLMERSGDYYIKGGKEEPAAGEKITPPPAEEIIDKIIMDIEGGY